jgi:hypothetical protein
MRWRSNWGPLAFVWGLWAASAYYLLLFVRAYGVDCPHFDEWENVPALTGEQPVTLAWLWSQHNEHRILLPRLIYLGLAKLTHGDFRGGMYFNAAVLCVEAAALIVCARKIRGRTEYADAFFPLLLQTWGQAENLYWSFQIQFICSAGLAVAFLVFSSGTARLRTPAAVALGFCGVMLPLVGGNGLALAPAVSVAVLLAGWGEWRQPRGKRAAIVVWALGIAAVALTAYYFVDYHRPTKHPHSESLQATFDAACQFLTVGFGQAAQSVWPESKDVLYALVSATVAMLVFVFIGRPAERGRAFRLLLVLGSGLCLALGIGWARTALSPDAMFAPRYPTLAAPFWCAIYLAWETLGRSQLRQSMQAGLFLLAASVATANHDLGRATAEGHYNSRNPIVTDIKAGIPMGEVIRRHGGFTYYGPPDVLATRMKMLHAKQIGVFRYLKP